MKRLDKIIFREMEGKIIYECDNGNFDISINKPQVIYENIKGNRLKLL